MLARSSAIGNTLSFSATDMWPLLALLKPRIVGLLVFVSLVAALVAGGGAVPPDRMLLLAIAGALSSAGASALNQYFERDLDAAMPRTRSRPLPKGKIAPPVALRLGISLIVLSLAPSLLLGIASTFSLLCGAFCYVVIYTLWLKRSSSWNVPIGGIAGSCAVITGWFAVRADLSTSALLMAAVILFWNQSHFWAFAIAKQDEYRTVHVPMLPVVVGGRATSRAILVNTLLMVLASLALVPAIAAHAVYLIGAALIGATFVVQNIRLVIVPTRETAWSNFKFSGVYLLVLFSALAIDALLTKAML